MSQPFNDLTPAEAERLALLLEELGEAQQAIGKILRHGYESHHPNDLSGPSNRDLLAAELGDVNAALELMLHERDVFMPLITRAMHAKLKKVQQYLHHQPESMFDGVNR